MSYRSINHVMQPNPCVIIRRRQEWQRSHVSASKVTGYQVFVFIQCSHVSVYTETTTTRAWVRGYSHACIPPKRVSKRQSRVQRASGSKYLDSLFTRRLILTLILRSPLKSPDTNVPGFSIRFHWIHVNERPKRIEMYPGFRESEAV